jgi:hypothetical protein
VVDFVSGRPVLRGSPALAQKRVHPKGGAGRGRGAVHGRIDGCCGKAHAGYHHWGWICHGDIAGGETVFTLAYRNLPSVATLAHIHGPAVSTNTAGVLINLAPYHQGPLGTQGVFVGTVLLTPVMAGALYNGDLYFNNSLKTSVKETRDWAVVEGVKVGLRWWRISVR